MKKFILLTVLLSTSVFAKLNVATTYNYLAKVTKKIGGELVNVTSLSSPQLDPHFITPKPSLIAKLRREDLLIINGGQLEIGWIPPLLHSANNPKIQNGAKGFLDVSKAIDLMDKPQTVSRSQGDVHPDGNPHFALDIHNVIIVGELISLKLIQLDPEHKQDYSQNYKKFQEKMQALADKLENQYKTCKGKKVVQYHELFNYALRQYKVIKVGDIEPLPGISPSSKHTFNLINLMKNQKINTILQDTYHEKKTSHFIASKTDATVVLVPHDVGALPETETLEKFYTTIGQAICQ
jgi:zinc/manganese transport system substrate-binding protein